MTSVQFLPHKIVINIIEAMETPEEILAFTSVRDMYLQIFRQHRNTILPKVMARALEKFTPIVNQLSHISSIPSSDSGTFSALPNELALMVMEECLCLLDVLALALTCRRFYNLYIFNRKAIMKGMKKGLERRFKSLYNI